jgi:hypothetical protein
MTDTITDYGVRINGVDYLPDEEGDIPLLEDGYIWARQAGSVEALARTVRDKGLKATLIERVTTTEVRPVAVPLPTTPGSVIRATVKGEPGVVLLLTDDGDNIPWRVGVSAPLSGDNYVGEKDLADVEVIYAPDAG